MAPAQQPDLAGSALRQVDDGAMAAHAVIHGDHDGAAGCLHRHPHPRAERD
jgi:hypothetical protein